MKIAVVHSFYSTESPSGENQVVEAQINALRAVGHDVLLLDKYTDQESKSLLYPLRAALSSAGLVGASPREEIERFRPDVVHLHNLFPNWGTGWLSNLEAPIVATLHNFRSVCASAVLWRDGHDCSDCLTDGSINALRNKCYRGSALASIPLAWSTRDGGRHSPVLNNASALVVLNNRSEEFYKGLRPDLRVCNIPNFASTQVDETVPMVSDSWIFVGRFVQEKGVSWLLENWPSTSKLEFVGSGPLSEEIEKASNADPNRIGYLGRLTPDETKRAIAQARGLVIPSLWAEGIPTVALEALSSGTPILISDRCSSALDLTTNNAGIVFSPEMHGQDFANLIRRIEQDGSYRRNAKDLYRQTFSENVWLGKIEFLYSDLAELHR